MVNRKMKNFNKTIQMLIYDGDPNGMIMCELSNWNGRIYKVSRKDLNKFAQRQDSENTGVYFLFGKNIENNDTVYIGEAEKILTRLKQHLKDENYWSDCFIVVSKDNLLNKAHVKYLENTFYNIALNAMRAKVINNTIPTKPSVGDFDLAMLEEFINNTKMLVNSLGYKVFDSISENIKDNNHKEKIFYIKAARGADGQGTFVSDGFAVFKNTSIANPTTDSISPYLKKLREKLITEGIINSNYKFTRDYIFTSPSLAASIVMGRNANGRTEWKTKTKKSLKDVEDEI